jgi:uncharacterized protein (DUF362 family)
MMEKVKVSVVKALDPYEGVRKAIDLIRPLSFGFRSTHVLVKPNLCSPFPPEENPSITHPDVIGATVRYLKEEGARKVSVGDEPVWGLKSRFCYEKSGVKAVVKREGGNLVYFDEEKRITRKVLQGRIYSSVSIPALLDEVDVLINVPKMKTSIMTLVTLCFKNLFGLVSFRDRKRFHRAIDLSYALIDIAKAVRPHLNLIDGIVAMEGMGAHGGTPYPLGLLIASEDMVAADIVGTQVMGFNPMEPVVNQLALKDGLGIASLDQIEIVGESLDEVKVVMERPIYRLVHPKPNVEVIPGGICPGCMSRIPRIPPRVEAGKEYAVIIGRRVRFPKERKFDEIWCFGDCGVDECKRLVTRYPDLKEKMKIVKGCPPLDWWRGQTIDKELKKKGWI